MPKIKQSPLKAQSEAVQRNIRAVGARHDCITDRDFARKTGMSASTVGRRRNEPGSWTLEELIKVSMVFKCPLQWLMTDHDCGV